MKWLQATRGRRFELARHFLARMFDSELCSTRGQFLSVAVSAFALLLPAGLLLVREGSPLASVSMKYRLLSEMATAGPLRAAMLADQISLLTLAMAVTGLVAVMEWQALFPGKRDYLALAGLPVRSRDIFMARCGAVLLFSTALAAALNLLPSLIAPLEFSGRWQKNSSYLANVGAQAAASALGCLFVFFAIIAIQGVLLNTLPRRFFGRITVYVQSALSAVLFLAALSTRFVQDWDEKTLKRLPEFGAWAPPIWFAGLHEKLLGDTDPFFAAMGRRALLGVTVAVALSALTYLLSYGRYRKLLVEAPVEISPPRERKRSILDLMARAQRGRAILQFMSATLGRSRVHRLIIFGYAGAGLGLLLNSSLAAGIAVRWNAGWRAALQFAFLLWPLAWSVILLRGFRHAFSVPAELGANWLFQITESQGRKEWLSAMERFLFAFAIAPIYAAMLPVGVAALGWPLALRTAALEILFSLAAYEALFYSWQQLPFTCSYVPGKRPLVSVVMSYIGALGVLVPIAAMYISTASRITEVWIVFLAIFLGVWIWWRRRRLEGGCEAPLLYEDVDSVIADLGIKDICYGRGEIELGRDPSGDSRHADSQDADPRSDAWVRGGGEHSTGLGRRAPSGGGSALPSLAPAGITGAAGRGVGAFGQQPPGQILPAYGSGAPSSGGQRGEMGARDDRDREDHESRLKKAAGRLFSALRLRVKGLTNPDAVDKDLEDELGFHIAMRAQQYQTAGASAEEAWKAARRRFGSLTVAKEECREMWTIRWMETLSQDLRYGLRQLRRTPGPTLVAAITLALGIGATTAIFSLCSALIWNTPRFPGMENLVVVLRGDPANAYRYQLSAPADVDDIRSGSRTLERLGSWANASAKILDSGGEPVRVDIGRVTPNLFEVLAVQPAMGRNFSPEEAQPGREREAILSDKLWRARFGADERILGKRIRLDDQDYSVIGVMPPGFAFPMANRELYTPLALTPEERASRTSPMVESVGRLMPGQSPERLSMELGQISSRLERLYPATNTGRRFIVWPLRRYFMGGGVTAMFGRMFFGASVFVLLIACVNVANIQFARAAGRRREVAVRTALGASRKRIVLQFATESLALAAGASALGVLIAKLALSALKMGVPPEIQRYSFGWSSLGIHAPALAFALLAAGGCGLAVGLGPAWKYSRPNLTESLKEGARGLHGNRRQRRLRAALMAAQLALAMALLTGAGLTIRGFNALLRRSTTVDLARVLTLRLDISAEKYREQSQVEAFYRSALERIASLPGVESAAAATSAPYSQHVIGTATTIETRRATPNETTSAQFESVSAAYFQTLRIPLRAGRALDASDLANHEPVAVINEAAAARMWPGNAQLVGKRFKLGGPKDPATAGRPWITVVGVAANVDASALDASPRPILYVPFAQHPQRAMDLTIRTAGDPMRLGPDIRAAIRAVDPEEPVSDVLTLERLRGNEAIAVTYSAVMMGLMGIIALALSMVGVYGLCAYLVIEQTHEIGVRVAMGASRGRVLRMVIWRSVRSSALGLGIGALLATALARALAAVLWGVNAKDVAPLGLTVILLGAAVLLATLVPARRATAVEPIRALREE